MPSGQLDRLVQRLRRSLRCECVRVTDGELLAAFIAGRDAEAFEGLVRRHGPMVLGVCRRVLGHVHDAEDAFQATFLVLARKAATVNPPELVGNWLYGVAYRTALELRGRMARRRAREKPMSATPEPPAPGPNGWADLLPLLDEELSRLPDTYRVPLVLCDLEGKTRKQAAHQLGWPEGTVAGRLARGRDLLARRLKRHGLVLSASAVAASLTQGAALASVPGPLVAATVQAAAAPAASVVSGTVIALTEEVVKAMTLTKLMMMTALVLALGLCGIGIGAMYTGQPRQKAKPAAIADDGDKPDVKPADKKADDPQLPTGPAPHQTLAYIAKEGVLLIRVPATTYREAKFTDPDGVEHTYYHPVMTWKQRPIDDKDVEVYGTDGKKIDAKKWHDLLKKETPVLVSSDGRKVDPLHLRLIKEGTLILVLPPAGVEKGIPTPPVAPAVTPPPSVIDPTVAPRTPAKPAPPSGPPTTGAPGVAPVPTPPATTPDGSAPKSP
jgi:RNA polymerase sigma factor (sigma-70 family)